VHVGALTVHSVRQSGTSITNQKADTEEENRVLDHFSKDKEEEDNNHSV